MANFTALIAAATKYFKADGAGTAGDPYVPRQKREPLHIADETNIVSAYLLNGGANEQNVDGSVTPVTYSYMPPSGKDFICARAMIYMEDSTNFSSTIFAGTGGALANGLDFSINGTVTFNVKTNHMFALFMFDVTGNDLFGKTNQILFGRFSFEHFLPNSDGITIRDGQTISTIVNDDLTGIDHLEVMVQGILVPV